MRFKNFSKKDVSYGFRQEIKDTEDEKIVVASDVSIAEDPIDGAAPKKVILEQDWLLDDKYRSGLKQITTFVF